MLQPGSTIGILGTGQLGRMLAAAAAKLGFKVETPFSFSSMRLTEYLVTKFPLEALPLMIISAKSRSHF
ncbi:MAG: hypothetical protein AAGA69_06955, partial [Pseudomonadota bacterium]